jgi:hypothetical protein
VKASSERFVTSGCRCQGHHKRTPASGANRLWQAQTLTNTGNDSIEPSGIQNCHLRQRPTVKFAANLLKSSNELAVAETPLTAGGVDPNDPKPAEISLASSSVSMGEDTSPDD